MSCWSYQVLSPFYDSCEKKNPRVVIAKPFFSLRGEAAVGDEGRPLHEAAHGRGEEGDGVADLVHLGEPLQGRVVEVAPEGRAGVLEDLVQQRRLDVAGLEC